MHGLLALFKETFKKWDRDNCPRLAAALAFYTLSSLAPLILFALVIAGSIFGQTAAREELLEQMDQLAGGIAVTVIKSILASAQNSQRSFWAGVAGLAVLLVSAGGVFVELQGALNLIFRSPPRRASGVRALVRDRAFSMLLVLGTGFLLLTSLILSAVLSGLSHYLKSLSENFLIALNLMAFFIPFVVITTLFALIFKWVPDRRIPFKAVVPGAILTALLFTLGKFLIGLYLGKSLIAGVYGAAGSFAILIVWVYYSAQIIFFGAELTYLNWHRTRVIESRINAYPISARKVSR